MEIYFELSFFTYIDSFDNSTVIKTFEITKLANEILLLVVCARLAPFLKTIFHQCVILFLCSQSNSDGSVLKQSDQS